MTHRIFMARLTRLTIIACLLACAGCGWQLQGAHRISPDLQPMYVEYGDQADQHSPFSRALQDRLRASGVELAQDESQAKVVLQITKEDAGHRVISVSPQNTPQEYDIYYTVEFTLKTRKDEVLLVQRLSTSQTMTYDKFRALAKQREEAMLSDTLAAELADQLLRQIRRL